MCRVKNGKQIYVYCEELIYFKLIGTPAFRVTSIPVKYVRLVRVEAWSHICAAKVDEHPFWRGTLPTSRQQQAHWAATPPSQLLQKTERLNIDWKLRAIESYFYWFARPQASRRRVAQMNVEAPVVNIDAQRSKAVVGTTLSHLCIVNFSLLKLVALLQSCTSIKFARSAFTSARCNAHQTAAPVGGMAGMQGAGVNSKCDAWLMSRYSGDSGEPRRVIEPCRDLPQLIKPARLRLSSQRRRRRTRACWASTPLLNGLPHAQR